MLVLEASPFFLLAQDKSPFGYVPFVEEICKHNGPTTMAVRYLKPLLCISLCMMLSAVAANVSLICLTAGFVLCTHACAGTVSSLKTRRRGACSIAAPASLVHVPFHIALSFVCRFGVALQHNLHAVCIEAAAELKVKHSVYTPYSFLHFAFGSRSFILFNRHNVAHFASLFFCRTPAD